MGKTEKVVIDTNVIISSLLKKEGITRLALSLIKQKKGLEILIPKELYEEIEKHRFEIARRAKISTKILSFFIATILKDIKKIDVKNSYIKKALKYVKDEKDAPFVAACLKTGANFILTFNRKDFEVNKLEKIGIKVMLPVEFLEYMGIDIGEIRTEFKKKGGVMRLLSRVSLLFKRK